MKSHSRKVTHRTGQALYKSKSKLLSWRIIGLAFETANTPSSKSHFCVVLLRFTWQRGVITQLQEDRIGVRHGSKWLLLAVVRSAPPPRVREHLDPMTSVLVDPGNCLGRCSIFRSKKWWTEGNKKCWIYYKSLLYLAFSSRYWPLFANSPIFHFGVGTVITGLYFFFFFHWAVSFT